MLTTTSLGELRQAQNRVVGRHRLKRDVAVPLAAGALTACVAILVQRLSLLRADDTDLVVFDTVLALGVRNRVDVQPGRAGLAGQLPKTLDELFLQIVVETVLLSEEYHSSLRD